MVCPYRVAVSLVTVVLGSIMLYLQFKKEERSDGSQPSDPSSSDEQQHKAPPPEVEWKDRSLAYKVTYVTCATVLLVMHLEWFTGGFLSVRVAKHLGVMGFGATNTTAAGVGAVAGAGAGASAMPPTHTDL